MKRPRSSEELAKQLEQETDDDALWTQEPTPIERRPHKTSILSLRLPTQEFHALLSAARSSGESVSEYVRQAIAMRQRQQESPVVNISTSHSGVASETEQSSWRTYTTGNPQDEPRVSVTNTNPE